MRIAVTREFCRAFAITAIALGVPAVIELVAGLGSGDVGSTMLFTAIFDLCLIALAGVLALLLWLAGYARQARGVIAGVGIGLVSLAAAIGIVVLAHQPPHL